MLWYLSIINKDVNIRYNSEFKQFNNKINKKNKKEQKDIL